MRPLGSKWWQTVITRDGFFYPIRWPQVMTNSDHKGWIFLSYQMTPSENKHWSWGEDFSIQSDDPKWWQIVITRGGFFYPFRWSQVMTNSDHEEWIFLSNQMIPSDDKQWSRGEHFSIKSDDPKWWLMPRSHIQGLGAGLATDTIRHHQWQSLFVRKFQYCIHSHK